MWSRLKKEKSTLPDTEKISGQVLEKTSVEAINAVILAEEKQRDAKRELYAERRKLDEAVKENEKLKIALRSETQKVAAQKSLVAEAVNLKAEACQRENELVELRQAVRDFDALLCLLQEILPGFVGNQTMDAINKYMPPSLERRVELEEKYGGTQPEIEI